MLSILRQAAFYNKNFQAAKSYNVEYLKKVSRPFLQARIYAQLGAIDILLNDYKSAESHLSNALAIDSTHAPAYFYFGYLMAAQGRYAEAEAHASKVFSLDSTFSYKNLSAWVLVSGDLDIDHGISLAQRALETKPQNWAFVADAYSFNAIPEHTLGLAFLKKGEYEKAVHYLEQAAAFAPARQAIREDLQRAREKLTEK